MKTNGRRKLIRVLAAVILICTVLFVGCSKNAEEPVTDSTQTITEKNKDYYANTCFAELERFDVFTGYTLNETDDMSPYSTEYKYVTFENPKATVNEYKNYLIDSGFTFNSDVDSETMSFKKDNQQLYISTETGNNGTVVTVRIPSDDKTIALRKESRYNEIIDIFNSDKNCFKISTYRKYFNKNEPYKDVEYYLNYALGIVSYKNGIYSCAHSYLSEVSEKWDSKVYLDEIEKYNGVYKKTGSVNLYAYIKNGEIDFGMENLVNYGDEVYYGFSLFYESYSTEEEKYLTANSYYGDGTTTTGSTEMYTLQDFADDGSFFVTNDEASNAFNGRYIKISDTPIPEKQ